MTTQRELHKQREVFREASEILDSLERFVAWEAKRFIDEKAFTKAQTFRTHEQLKDRLREALAEVDKLPQHQRATFRYGDAYRLLGGKRGAAISNRDGVVRRGGDLDSAGHSRRAARNISQS